MVRSVDDWFDGEMMKTDLKILLVVCIVCLAISNILTFSYIRRSWSMGYEYGYKVGHDTGLVDGQWDYVNGRYYSRHLWESAIPQLPVRVSTRVSIDQMVCEGYVDQHPNPMYAIDCE